MLLCALIHKSAIQMLSDSEHHNLNVYIYEYSFVDSYRYIIMQTEKNQGPVTVILIVSLAM